MSVADDPRRATEMRPSASGTNVLCIGAEALEGVVQPLSQRAGARLADFFGSLEDGQLVLRLVYALDVEGEYVILEWPITGEEYPSLSDVAPAAFVEECEIYEQFGARPAGAKLLNRLVVPPHAGHGFPRLGQAPRHAGRAPHAPHYVSGEAFEFPVGPVRGVAQESLYTGLVTSGEEVIDLYLLQWHKHRGIERRLRGTHPANALFIVERAEGLSSVGNGWTFCRAVEAALDVTVPAPVERARAIALELERLYNHAASIAALCQTTGLSVGQAQAEIALEQFLRLNLAVFGHRYLFGVLAVGGTTRPPDVVALQRLLPSARDELCRVIEALWSTNSFMDRLEACGIVAHEAAGRLGLVGPVARGSGWERDCRRKQPYGPYADVDLAVPVEPRGDVLARMRVMVAEIDHSAQTIEVLCRAGTAGGVGDLPARAGTSLGWCESSRGESLAWVALDERGLIERARLRPASVRNWRAFDDAARAGNVFTDVPIIEASFWLTVAGFAR